jgi:pilus assembly protein CpaF
MSVISADAHTELVESLDQRVREAVRREGVDPQLDASVVRRLAEAVVRAHDERSLTGIVAPVSNVESMVGELVARVSGFGPLQAFLDDPTVEEVWINDPSRVFIARHGRHELTNLMLTSAQVAELVERMLKSSGRRIDLSRPFVDAMLPEGHRLHVVLEGISRGWTAVNIRKFVLTAARLHELVELGTLSPAAAAFLEASVRAGLNILVAGGTQAGKTTLLNCLAAAIPGGERVVSAEEVFELPNMCIVQTCERLSTSDKAWIEQGPALRSTASVRTASSCAPSAAGRSPGSGPTTTSARRLGSRDRPTRRCSRPSSAVRLGSSSPGTWTGSPAD